VSTYTVRKGDTLSGIAAHFGITLAELEAANPDIHNPNLSFVGQHIPIPGGSGPAVDIPAGIPEQYRQWLGLVLAARIKQVQSAMPMVQLIITPLMFLSGALFPLSGLPTWLTVLTHLNPMTYAVEPMRSVVFDQLQVDPATRATFDPGIFWNHWQVPVGLQVILVIAVSVVLLAAAVARFARTE